MTRAIVRLLWHASCRNSLSFKSIIVSLKFNAIFTKLRKYLQDFSKMPDSRHPEPFFSAK